MSHAGFARRMTGSYQPPNVDPYWAFVTSLIQGRSSIVDELANTVTLDGGVGTGTTYDAGGSIVLDGVDDRVRVGGAGGVFAPGNGPFALEMFAIGATTGQTAFAILADTSDNGSATNGMFLEWSPSRGQYFYCGIGAGYVMQDNTYPTDGVPHHLMVARGPTGVLVMGRDGLLVERLGSPGAVNITNAAGAAALGGEGNPGGGSYRFKGGIYGWRMTVGSDRGYAAGLVVGDPYTVPSMPLPTS